MPAQAREKNGLNRLHHRGAGHKGSNLQIGQSFPSTIYHDPHVEDLSHARLGITADWCRCLEVCVLDILIHDPFNVNIGRIQVYLCLLYTSDAADE